MNRVIGMLLALSVAGCARAPKPTTAPGAQAPAAAAGPALLPSPAVMEVSGADSFRIVPETAIVISAPTAEMQSAASQLSELIRRSTGITPGLRVPPQAPPASSVIVLTLNSADPSLSPEGYDLAVKADGILLQARSAAGLFYGVQTIRQLLPYWGEYEAIMFRQPRPATIPALHIRDSPRFEWRGAMLDVARHFFTVGEVKRFIDLLALHKMNRLHLHLADDQGWRIEIAKWPDLTAKGSRTEVGGTPGGSYTKAQYGEIVAYAADRFITIVPEIDMPGHTNAALSSYAELNCDGVAPPPYTGTEVGFSALCVDKEVTYRFLDDVVGEIAAMTPGPYFHVGGDEVKKLTPAQYKAFVERVQTIVLAHGKQMIGWDEIAATSLDPTSIVQHWRPKASQDELARAPRLVLSPGDRAYLDMKYDANTALGLNWAGLIPVRAAYDWDPAARVPGARQGAILGVEAPVWSETVANMYDVEFLAMPRLAIIAEIAWSPAETRDWDRFRVRLGAEAPRWSALGINFYRAPEVPWK